LFKSAIGAVVLFAFFICVETASALDIEVSPSRAVVSFSFGQSIDNTESPSFTITNNENTTVSGDIIIPSTPPHITITGPSSFSCSAKSTTSVQFTIVASPSPSGEDETHTFTMDIGGKPVTTIVTIIYYARIEISRPSIDFGRVHRTDNPSEMVTISEVYGYKTVDIGSRITGNSWLTATLTGHTVKKGSPVTITFQLNPGQQPDRNRYSWTFSLSTTTRNTEIRPSSIIPIEAYILMPPKLGKLYDEDLEIKFDKPKGTVSKYDRYIDVRVRNEGDETMYFNSRITEYPSRITIEIVNPSGSVSGKSSENIRLHIVAPYDAPEGTYRGKLYVDAKGAGQGYVDITIKIIWPVDFTISSSSPYFTPSPLFIDFGSLELKELGYEKKRVNLTLTEVYRYKPVRNFRFSTSGEYGNWLKEEMEFLEIPPGESGNITLKIEPGLEAVPKDYSWMYYISAYEISAKRIDVKAKIVPMNIPEMIEYLNSFRESPLHDSYPSSEVIISNGVGMLEVIEGSEIGAEDWKKIPVLMKGTLSLLSSLNDGIMSSEEENYGKAVDNLVSASVSTSTIGSNSELNNLGISGYAKDISTGADKTTEEVLIDEAKKLELRGWNIKKAVEHAMALDDISGLKEEENVLESALSYQYAATIYGLLNDKEKRIESMYEESVMMDKHDELVSDATDLRIKAENVISNSKENDLIRIADTYLLVNPYKYDTFSANYKTAESYLEDASTKYKVAGELLMSGNTEAELKEVKSEWGSILFLFSLACIFYAIAFIHTINRVIMGTMAYMRDRYERELGDIVVT